MNIRELLTEYERLQKVHGSSEHDAIYGAGKMNSPEICLVFMNPTARNISSSKDWQGLKAPWLATRPVWQMLFDLGLLSDKPLIEQTQKLKPHEWTEEFSSKLYAHVAEQSLYITNIAKCTQVDARPLKNLVFRDYLDTFYEEIGIVRPKAIVLFGNQVSSIALKKNITVSDYLADESEEIMTDNGPFAAYPCYYPVGQGRRNMPLAKRRLQNIIELVDKS